MASENIRAESTGMPSLVASQPDSGTLKSECPCETHPNDANCCCKESNSGEKQEITGLHHHHHHNDDDANSVQSDHKEAPPLQPIPSQLNYQPYISQNGNCPQQCFCLMPVPSGLPHAPFVYQCIPISSPVNGPIPMPPMQGCPVPQSVPPSVQPSVPMLSPALSATNLPPPPPCAPPQMNDSAQKPVEATSIDNVATTLTQMRTGGGAGGGGSSCCVPCQPVQSSGTKSCKPVGGVTKGKPRSHACNWRDTWGYTCQRTFTRPYDLLRHQETVHCSDTKSYCCEYCGCTSKKFSRQDSLARHIRRMHQNVAQKDIPLTPVDKASTPPEPVKVETQNMPPAPQTPLEAKTIAYSSILDGNNNDQHEQPEPELKKTEPIMKAQAV